MKYHSASYHWYADDFTDSPDVVTTITKGVLKKEYYACWISRMLNDLVLDIGPISGLEFYLRNLRKEKEVDNQNF